MKSNHRIETVFVLVVFCVFAASVLTVLTLSGSVYRDITAISRNGDNEQTCLSYVWSKVKNQDTDGAVYLSNFDGIRALCLDESIGEDKYTTRIYILDGWINELMADSGGAFVPADGTPVLEVESFSLSDRENGVIEVVSGGKSLLIYPRGGGGL